MSEDYFDGVDEPAPRAPRPVEEPERDLTLQVQATAIRWAPRLCYFASGALTATGAHMIL